MAVTSLRILVTGSRDWDDYSAVAESLDDVIGEAIARTSDADILEITVVHGACPTGADKIAAGYCEDLAWWHDNAGRTLRHEPRDADWKKHGKPAGFIRNAEMVNLGADVCLAFIAPCVKESCREPQPHGSHGARHCADLAENAGIDTRRCFSPALAAGGLPAEVT